MPGDSLECLPAYRAAEALEAQLGDPFAPSTPFSLSRALALDEQEEFPAELIALLQKVGYFARLVPREQGGALGSFEEACALQRSVARRDLTTAIALGQAFLGSVPVWLAGSAEQKSAQAALIGGGGLAALALTEEAHGADVLESELRADPAPGGVQLTGTKWLINNGTRAASLAVFAREAGGQGLSGFSIFLVHRDRLGADSCRALPKQSTLGIRGADISGIEFNGALLPDSARIGKPGSGAELLLQSLQLTRIGCCSFSLGAADTALRLAMDFALSRQLYGARVWDIPHARDALTCAFVDLLAADCVATAAARAVHAAPEQLSLISAIAKVFVPLCVESVLGELATLSGARHYLRSGSFQKILRDAAVVPLFDGSVPVNLDAIGTQLLRLSPRNAAAPDERERVLQSLFELTSPLPPFDPSKLALLNGGRDDVTQSVAEMIQQLSRAPATPWREELATQLNHLLIQLNRAADELQALATLDRQALKRSAELFHLARRHCTLFAAASCAQLWLRSGARLGSFTEDGGWLALCLDRLLSPLLSPAAPRRHAAMDGVARELLHRHANNRAFSLAPLQLAPRVNQ